MNVSKNIREGVRVCQNEDDWTAAPSDLRGIAIEYACYFSKKIQEVGRKRAICISPENVVSLLSTVRRAPNGALFSSPKGRFIVRARGKTVASYLGVTDGTYRNAVLRIRKKLGLNNDVRELSKFLQDLMENSDRGVSHPEL